MDVPANRSGGADRESEQSRRAVPVRCGVLCPLPLARALGGGGVVATGARVAGVGGRDLQALLGTPRSVSSLASFVAGLRLQASSEPDCRRPMDPWTVRGRHFTYCVLCAAGAFRSSGPSVVAGFVSGSFLLYPDDANGTSCSACFVCTPDHAPRVNQRVRACSTLSLPVGSCSSIVSLPRGCVRGVRRAHTAGGKCRFLVSVYMMDPSSICS